MPIHPKRPIIQMTLEGDFVDEFPSVKAASKQFGGTNSQRGIINNAATVVNTHIVNGTKANTTSRKSNIAFGYKWKFKET